MCFSIAADPDLDSLLDNLHKVKEEAAAATAVQDPRRPTVIAKQNRQLPEEEFDNFMQNLQLSDIIHLPTMLTMCDSAKLSRRKSLAPEEDSQESVYKHRRPSFCQHTESFNLPRPSSVTTPHSPSQVCT